MSPGAAGGRWVDPARYPRRLHLAHFLGYEEPFWSVTVEVDVTALYDASRAADGATFFLGCVYASMRAANAVPEFRQRLRAGRIWEHARVEAGATVLRADDTFGFAYFAWADDFGGFAPPAREEIARVSREAGPSDPRDDRDDLIHHSVLPWLRFTAFGNARRGGGESTPKVVFGRHGVRGRRRRMPVAIEVHHALLDGLHVARYVERLERELGAWDGRR